MCERKLLENKDSTGCTIKTIRTVLAEESYETKQHCDRVSEFCKLIGSNMGLDLYELKELEHTAQIHDVGKIAIKDSILNKKSTLTKSEWEKMKMHPEIGYKIAKEQPTLNQIAEYIVAHHERWDGKGYPYGLKGEIFLWYLESFQ
jgi:HD-GYP domain-containing protein (c-di-GMP phosphodiesterase class II)